MSDDYLKSGKQGRAEVIHDSFGWTAGHRGSTYSFHRPLQTSNSYPHPSERRTSKLRLLPPGPGQVRLVNTVTPSLRRTLRDRRPQRTDTHCSRVRRRPVIFYASPRLSARPIEGLRSRPPASQGTPSPPPETHRPKMILF